MAEGNNTVNTNPQVTSGKTSWIYDLSKQQIYENCMRVLLPVQETMTLDELRRIYRTFLKKQYEQAFPNLLIDNDDQSENATGQTVIPATNDIFEIPARQDNERQRERDRRERDRQRDKEKRDRERQIYQNRHRDLNTQDTIETQDDFFTNTSHTQNIQLNQTNLSAQNVVNNTILQSLSLLLSNMQRQQTNPNQAQGQHDNLAGDLKRWNITFSANTSDSVNKFLEMVDLFECNKNATATQMYKLIPEMLKDKALTWFLANRSNITTWTQFKSEIKKAYSPPGYDIKLKRDMFSRTQHRAETFHDFVTTVKTTNSRLDAPLNDYELTQLIRSNLNPYFSRQLNTKQFNSYRDLLNWGRDIEANRAQADSYQQPPSSMVDQEFVFPSQQQSKPFSRQSNTNQNQNQQFRNPNNSAQNSNRNQNQPQPQNSNTQQSKNSNNETNHNETQVKGTPQKCWNCQELGHRFANCTKQKKRFCHACGKQNTISSQCDCPKKGNS
jgi:hypothetical protein